MTTRVSTGEGWNSALMNLMRAQERQFEAQNRVSSEKIAQDLKGYGRTSETLTAFKSANARLNAFITNGEAVGSRLVAQDLAMTNLGDAVDGARQAISEALAAGRAEALMIDLEGRFQQALDSLNAKHEGRYLFAGGRTDTRPVTGDTMADLTATPTVDPMFVNDELRSKSRLDDFTVVETGFLADEMGAEFFGVMRQIQAFHEATPIDGQLTDAQRTFLEGIVGQLQDAHEGVVNTTARNGSLQNRVDIHVDSQKEQSTALEELISNRTDVDMAEAITDLQQAQISVQASAQVIAQLRGVSLLDLLS